MRQQQAQDSNGGMTFTRRKITLKNKFKLNADWTVDLIVFEKGEEHRVKVSFSDFYEKLAFNSTSWCVSRASDKKNPAPYIRGLSQGHKTRLHRYLTDAPEGLVVDHINHDTLDNTRENLRITTNRDNTQRKQNNKSGVVGVRYDRASDRWCAGLMLDGKTLAKTFSNAEAAVKQRQAWELEVYGKTMAVDRIKWSEFVRQVEAKRGESA